VNKQQLIELAASLGIDLEELCLECEKRPCYDGDYCEFCQRERDEELAEMIGDMERGH